MLSWLRVMLMVTVAENAAGCTAISMVIKIPCERYVNHTPGWPVGRIKSGRSTRRGLRRQESNGLIHIRDRTPRREGVAKASLRVDHSGLAPSTTSCGYWGNCSFVSAAGRLFRRHQVCGGHASFGGGSGLGAEQVNSGGALWGAARGLGGDGVTEV